MSFLLFLNSISLSLSFFSFFLFSLLFSPLFFFSLYLYLSSVQITKITKNHQKRQNRQKSPKFPQNPRKPYKTGGGNKYFGKNQKTLQNWGRRNPWNAKRQVKKYPSAQGLRFRVPGKELKKPSSLEIRTKYEKKHEIPHPGSGPETTKEIQKNTKTAQKFRIFCIFSYFRSPTRGREFCVFFRIFVVFPGLRGFWALYQERAIATQGTLPC